MGLLGSGKRERSPELAAVGPPTHDEHSQACPPEGEELTPTCSATVPLTRLPPPPCNRAGGGANVRG